MDIKQIFILLFVFGLITIGVLAVLVALEKIPNPFASSDESSSPPPELTPEASPELTPEASPEGSPEGSPEASNVSDLLEKKVIMRHIDTDKCITVGSGSEVELVACDKTDSNQQWKYTAKGANSLPGYYQLVSETASSQCLDYDGHDYELRNCSNTPQDHRDFQFHEEQSPDAGKRKLNGTIVKVKTGQNEGNSGCLTKPGFDNDVACKSYNYELSEI